MREKIDIDYVIQALLRRMPYDEIATQESVRLGQEVSRNVIAGIHRDLKNGKLRPSNKKQDEYVFGVEPDNGGLPVFNGHPVIDGNVVVISDIHAPFTDIQFARTVPRIAEYYDIETLIIAGDLFDGNKQNNFRTKTLRVSFQKELSFVRDLLDFYSSSFEYIMFAPGNHDDWFLENNEGELEITDLARLIATDKNRGSLWVTPYDRVTVNSGHEVWTIPHQRETSSYSLAVGEKLAYKFNSNVIVTHQHNSALGFDRYGRHVIIDVGGLHDDKKMAYVQLKTTTRPRYDKGYAVIFDGMGQLITPDRRVTDWSKYE